MNEIIGSYDPMPNERDEKLVSLDMERFAYWLGQGAKLTPGVQDLLGEQRVAWDKGCDAMFLMTGICGVTPISPAVVEKALRVRSAVAESGKKSSES